MRSDGDAERAMPDKAMPDKAVILINLGTPDTPDAKGVRAFLKAFLSDRRVVEVPRLLWLFILYCIILPFRSPKVAKKYLPLWAAGDSPLRLFSEQLRDQVQEQLDDEARVCLAMTYGRPGISDVLDELRADGVNAFCFIPLFPQYSATTTAAAMDIVGRYFQRQRDIPAWNWVRNYHDDDYYIAALAAQVRSHWASHGRHEKLLMSFHGIPKRNILLGDPYQRHCEVTAQRLADELSLSENEWVLTYQSRLGKAEWLQPYTDKSVEQLARDGCKSLDVIAPSFAVDCLETLEELDTEAAEIFYEHGGESFSYIPCLNASQDHASLLALLARKNLQVF